MATGKHVAVLQSSYIPWKGYFDIIHDVDTFIFYDDVQFTRQDWRSRNRICTPNGPTWLSIPAGSDIQRLIHEVRLEDDRWQGKHWKSLQQAYGRAPYFKQYRDFFEHMYLGKKWDWLSEFNQSMTRSIAKDLLGLKTEFLDSRDFEVSGKKLDRLIDLVGKSGAAVYVSGPAAAGYIDASRFSEIGVELRYKDYSGYPEYPQGGADSGFRHDVSIVDLLFRVGDRAPHYIWGWRDGADRAIPRADPL